MEYQVITQSPDELSEGEFNDFVALVLEGGEVTPANLEERVRKAERLILLSAAGCLRGIGALKKPNETYRRRVASASGTCLPVSEYPFELGWIFVSPSYRRKGLAGRIVEAAVSVANGVGVFATSRSENVAIHKVLQRHGFFPTGKISPSDHGTHELQLFVRVPCERRAAGSIHVSRG